MSTRRAALKAVIRQKSSAEDARGRTTYRYMVLGLIVTDAPIAGVVGDRVWQDDNTGLADMLDAAALRAPKEHPLGDADDVMTRLGRL